MQSRAVTIASLKEPDAMIQMRTACKKKLIIAFSYLMLLSSGCRNKQEPQAASGSFSIPSSVKAEHQSLLQSLDNIRTEDSVFIILNELIVHHFSEEEKYILPWLGQLPSIAQGRLPSESIRMVEATDAIKEQLIHLDAEHQAVNMYLNELKTRAAPGTVSNIEQFAEAIHRHAKLEEEVLFPAVLLMAEFTKLSQQKGKK